MLLQINKKVSMKLKKINKDNFLLLVAASPEVMSILPMGIVSAPSYYSVGNLVRLILKCVLFGYLLIVIPASLIWGAQKRENFLKFYKSKLFLALSLIFGLVLLFWIGWIYFYF
jgi:hypothetical protein